MNKRQRQIVIIGVGLLLLYWFFFRKKPKMAYAGEDDSSWIEDMYGGGGGYYGWGTPAPTGEDVTGDGTEEPPSDWMEQIEELRPPSVIPLDELQYIPSKVDDDSNQMLKATAYGGVDDAIKGYNDNGVPTASGSVGTKVDNLYSR